MYQKLQVHSRLLAVPNLKPFSPVEHGLLIDQVKDGSFHLCTSAIALYCTAAAIKAHFPEDLAPFGYLFERNGEMFVFGVYKKPHNKNSVLYGYILPLTASVETIAEFSKQMIPHLDLEGVYARYLRRDAYVRLMSDFRFDPAREVPFSPEAPEEDEGFPYSKLNLVETYNPTSSRFISKEFNRQHNRGRNFLTRANLPFSLSQLTPSDLDAARSIVNAHFKSLRDAGRPITSVPDDYFGLLSDQIITRPPVLAYLGRVGDLPTSVFVCERLSDDSVGYYAGMTIRDEALLLENLKLGSSDIASLSTGISALPSYALAELIKKLVDSGVSTLLLGGSESTDLNAAKVRMGAELDPTYWAVLQK